MTTMAQKKENVSACLGSIPDGQKNSSCIKTDLTQKLEAEEGRRYADINCGCFCEKFLESLGGIPDVFSKKDMSKEGGALQHTGFFRVHNFDC